jgi:hypothetical protein
VIAPCVDHVPLKKIPAHVIVVRAGKRLHNRPKLSLTVGDRIFVGRPAVFTFSYGGNRYRIPHASITLRCRSLRIGRRADSVAKRLLVVDLESGEVRIRAGSHAREAVVVSREMLAFATIKHSNFIVKRNPATALTSAYTFDEPIITADARIPKLRINTRATYTAVANRQGIRLNVWQFDLSSLQRTTTPADALPPYWADGSPCAVGCAPPGLVPGWPLKPFHEQHVVRAGINEVRPANLHVAVDIQANDLQAVYPIYSGRAYPAPTGSYGDYNIRVGPYIYWHVRPRVHPGQWVTAYRTVLGQVESGFGHIAFSQGSTARTLNPLRPGGGLIPYTDTEPPVIDVPRIYADGRVIVRAFDPQSFIHKLSYLTPVLAPSSLAWRLYNSKGHAVTGLEWAMRGSQNYPPGDAPIIYAPGASNPGFGCFFRKLICIPNWIYNLAGGLTASLPLGRMSRGRYRLTVYAWDWKGNTSALDYWFTVPLGSAATVPLMKELGPLNPQYEP